MSLLIQNGRVITAVDDYGADVFIEDEKIYVIGKKSTDECRQGNRCKG